MIPQLFNAQLAQYATPTITGESSVVIEDGIKCYLPELKVAGNTAQQTYTGKNILNATAKSTGNKGEIKYSQFNNIITLDGSDTRDGHFIIYTLGPISLEMDKTYTGRIELIGGECEYGGVAIYLYKDDNFYTSFGLLERGTVGIKNVTISSEGAYDIRIAARTASTPNNTDGKTVNYKNAQYRVSLYEGSYTYSTIPPYEPYVGGIPAPNPDHPQDIINAGDKGIEVEVRGNNLQDISKISGGQNLNWIAIDNGWEFTRGSATHASYATFKPFKVKENTTYYFSVDCSFLNSAEESNANPNKLYIYAASAPSNSSSVLLSVNALGKHTEQKTIKFTVKSSNLPYMFIRFYSNVGNSAMVDYKATLKNIMVTSDNYAPYEPYVEPQKITIPSSVKVDGKVVDLAFRYVPKYQGTSYKNYYDYLKVDTVNKLVKYVQNTQQFVCDGTEYIDLVYDVIGLFHRYVMYSHPMAVSPTVGAVKGYCSHLGVTNAWNTPTKEAIVCGASNQYFYFFLNKERCPDTASVKEWLKAEYDKGTPVTIVSPYKETIHDITDSPLGGQLLALAQNNGTAIIEIKNANNLSQTLSAKYLTHS